MIRSFAIFISTLRCPPYLIHIQRLSHPCNHCSNINKSRDGLRQHIAANHSDTNQLKLISHPCNLCEKGSKSKDGLRQHIKAKHMWKCYQKHWEIYGQHLVSCCMVKEILSFLSCVTFCGPPIVECGRKAVRVKAPVHPHLMSTREGGATATFYIEFPSDFCLILNRYIPWNARRQISSQLHFP